MEAYGLLVLGIFVALVALGCSCPAEELDLVGNATLTCFTNDSCEARCYHDYIFPTGYATINFSCHDGQWTPRTSSCKSRGWSCYREELDLVENAHLRYLTNDLCEATCYTGYIFPTGYTMKNFSCHDGQWTPRTSSCKRVPVTGYQFETVLGLNLDPYRCNKTLQNLKYYTKDIEYIWGSCKRKYDRNFTFHFYNEIREDEPPKDSYFYPPKDSYYYVNFGFFAEFTNYTSNYTLSSCLLSVYYSFESTIRRRLLRALRYGACENKSVDADAIFYPPYPETKYQHCPQGLELKNITLPTYNFRKRIEFFCDNIITINVNDNVTENVTENAIDGDETTTLPTESNRRSTIDSKYDIHVKIVTYVVPSIIGVIIVSRVVIFIACKKRSKKWSRKKISEEVVTTPL